MTIEEMLKKVKPRVERLLQMYPDTTNNDTLLQVYYALVYDKIDLHMPDKFIKANSSYFESIRRQRQTIQNTERRFPPTDINIALKRGWAEDAWREYFGK